MNALDVIIKKRDGHELSTEEIDFFIKNYTKGNIPDYQATAFLMAIYFRGMTKRETADLTFSMVNSGETIDLSSIPGIKVDKHSTGGVGDTTTLIAVPLAAACGVPIAKMSGRGLGHTGGTVDKLESIPGFKVSLSMEEFIESVKSTDLAVVSQTANLVPADRLLYALRDVTGTVDSMPLIASSIMSKKIASGANRIVLDVKTGNGAFMKTVEDSFSLAREMVSIGKMLDIKTIALITSMDQPLGSAIGNALEVWEAIEVLKGNIEGPLKEVSLLLATYMVYAGEKAETLDKARIMVEGALNNGKGLLKLRDMIKNQQGDVNVIENPDLLPKAKSIIEVKSESDGYITEIDAQSIGKCALILGAGRTTKESAIDYSAGIVMKKRIGEYVNKGDTLGEFHLNDMTKYSEAHSTFVQSFKIGTNKPRPNPVVLGIVTEDGVDKNITY